MSNALGWVYFLSWSVAEYPMLYFNYTRKAASEDSLDHVAFYLIGDASYTAFTCILLWSNLCREPRYASPALNRKISGPARLSCRFSNGGYKRSVILKRQSRPVYHFRGLTRTSILLPILRR